MASKLIRTLGLKYTTCLCGTDTMCEGFVVSYDGIIDECWVCEKCIASGELDLGD